MIDLKKPLPDYFFPILMALTFGVGMLNPLVFSFLPQTITLIWLGLNFKTLWAPLKKAYKSYAGLGAGFLALLFFGSVLSMDVAYSFERSIKIILLIVLSLPVFVMFKSFSNQQAEIFKKMLFFLSVFMCFFYAFEMIFGFPIHSFVNPEIFPYPPYEINKAIVCLALLFPFIFYSFLESRKNRGLLIVYVFLMGIILYLTQSQAAQICFFVFVVLAFMYRFCPKTTIRSAFIILGAMAFVFPFVAIPLKNYVYTHYEISTTAVAPSLHSGLARLEMYDFVAKKVFEKPLLGHGVGVSNLIEFDSKGPFYMGSTINYPHNAYMQIWLEFGLYGVCALCLFLFGFQKRILSYNEPRRKMVFLTLFMFLSVLMVSWSIWASWFVAMMIMLLSLTCLFSPKEAELNAHAH